MKKERERERERGRERERERERDDYIDASFDRYSLVGLALSTTSGRSLD